MSVYNTVTITRPKRAGHNLSHNVRTDARIGELFLISRPIECVPGDTMKLGNISEVQLAPMVSPSKGQLDYETFCFFVSNDMLKASSDSDTFTNILSSMLDESPKALPLSVSSTPVELRSYAEQMGIPAGFVAAGKNLLLYPLRSIVKIYNDWIRDENLQSEIPLNGISNYVIKANRFHINYKKNRITSAFTSPQKGKDLRMPIGNYAPIVLVNDSVHWLGDAGQSNSHTIAINVGTQPVNLPIALVNGTNTDDQIDAANSRISNALTSQLQADLRQVTGVSIDDLRLYNKLQKWEERNQLYGSRPKEFLLGNYGIAPNDEVLDRPVLIGHTRTPVIISNVTANIESSNTSTAFSGFQGSKAGNGSSNSRYYYGKWLCKEFGWIITLGCLRPRYQHVGGVHPSLIKSNVYDFFNSIFQTLGQVPIKQGEVFGLSDNFNSIFGYTDPYNELRGLEDMTTGVLTDSSLESWSINRKYASDQTPASVIEVNPSDYDYLFEVQSITLGNGDSIPAPHAIIESQMVVKAVRPVSKYPHHTL